VNRTDLTRVRTYTLGQGLLDERIGMHNDGNRSSPPSDATVAPSEPQEFTIVDRDAPLGTPHTKAT